ncbi:MAG: tRNA (adenosine(37)-N6)-threonylcarbamoyltransferase complex dimerization subunit type 1 TsaB [Patescibacteria group bacterium]|nr:tRNA (adenosine(37)-N6)-threonylcarbamoyltransferase complex dimerization subunit type 1 TsaB [Patescibacteria group bacterium]
MGKTLLIDTSDNKKIKVGLKIDKKVFYLNSNPTALKSQVVLVLIDKILKKNGLQVKDLTEIEVNLGPGSFTGARVGVSVANALGFSLKIPVNGKKVGDLTEPVYNK